MSEPTGSVVSVTLIHNMSKWQLVLWQEVIQVYSVRKMEGPKEASMRSPPEPEYFSASTEFPRHSD